jgi:hypothetical protein
VMRPFVFTACCFSPAALSVIRFSHNSLMEH